MGRVRKLSAAAMGIVLAFVVGSPGTGALGTVLGQDGQSVLGGRAVPATWTASGHSFVTVHDRGAVDPATPGWCALQASYGEQFDLVSASSPTNVWVSALGSESAYPVIGRWNGHSWRFWCDGRYEYGLAAVSPSEVWAAGSDLRRWNGRGWQAVSDPIAVGASADSVSASSSTNAWIAGTTVARWDGRLWTTMHGMQRSRQFGYVSTRASNDTWVVVTAVSGSEIKTPKLEYWNGRRWTTFFTASGALHSLGAVQAVVAGSPNSAWAVGRGVAHWNGHEWRTSPYAFVSGEPVSFSSVDVTVSGRVWATGQDANGATVIENWNGRSWSATHLDALQRSFSYGDPAIAVTRGGNDVWAVGWDVVEHWNGGAWKPLPSALPGEYAPKLTSVAAVAPNEFWMAGSYFRSASGSNPYGLIERWDGASGVITPEASPNSHAAFNGIGGTSSDDVWAVGKRIRVADRNTPSALIEHWSGRAWKIMPNPAASYPQSWISTIDAIKPNDVWVAGSHGANTAFFEHWNGRSWAIVPGATPQADTFIAGISGVSSNDVWAVGSAASGSPLIQHWNGKKWTVLPANDASGSEGGLLSSVTAVNGKDAWAAGANIYGTDLGALVEHWNGRKWSVAPNSDLIGDSGLGDITAVSGHDIWIVGAWGGPYKPFIQHWDGAHWTVVRTPFIGGNNILNAVAGTSEHNVWAVGGEIYVQSLEPVPIEHWNGKAWKAVVGPAPHW
jgi:hypothetical protein